MELSQKLTGRKSISNLKRQEWLLFLALVFPNLLLFFVFNYYPLFFNTYLSFTYWDMLSPIKVWIGLDNYLKLLVDKDFITIITNTFYFSGASVLSTTILGLLTALLLNQPLRFRNGVRSTVFAPTVLSGAAIGIVWIYILDPRFGILANVLGMVGITSPKWLTTTEWAMPAVIMVYAWKNMGYSTVIFLAGLKAIPPELYEAALVDGADWVNRFWHVTLPGLSPIIFFLILTNTLTSFQAFDIIKIMTNGGPVDATNTLVYYLYEQGFIAFSAGKAGVAAVLMFGMMFIFTVLQFRYSERHVHYS